MLRKFCLYLLVSVIYLYRVLFAGWMVRGSNSERGKRLVSFADRPDLLWGQQSHFFPWRKANVVHLPASSAEVKNVWSYTSTPPVCLHGVDGDNLTFSPFCNQLNRDFVVICVFWRKACSANVARDNVRKVGFEICALLGYNAASSGNPLPTFRNNVSVPSSRVKKSSVEW
jgi:hypothetical protein